jgi:hypothetical protein
MKKRIFLIGTGPSLNVTPLEKLTGEDTMAINKIHLIYPKTTWRPTYLWYVDFTTRNKKWRDPIDINKDIVKHMWLLKDFKEGLPESHPNHKDFPPEMAIGNMDNVTWVPRCEKHRGYSGGNPKGMQEWHLPEICTALNGVSSMIQASVLMGYEEIYLVGFDLGYDPDFTKSHFDPDYKQGNVPSAFTEAVYWAQADEFNATCAHKIAKTECDKRNIPLRNATIGGQLEVHPRVNLLEVLNGA